MNDERRLRVARLAQAESRARRAYEAMGYANTAGLTAEQREALDIAYALAWADWADALGALHAEVGMPKRVFGMRVVEVPSMQPDAFRIL